jgi:hypothetical protein
MGERKPVALGAILKNDAVSFANESLDVADLILLGLITGAWPRFEGEVSRGLVLERDGAETVGTTEVSARATQFRYSHRLLSASEFTSWLAARSLTVADLAGVLRRALLRERVLEGAGLDSGGKARPDELAGVLRAEALCSGILGELAAAAIEVMAAAHRLGRLGSVVAADMGVEATVGIALGCQAAGLAALGAGGLRRRVQRLWSYEDARSALREQLAEPIALRRQLAGHGLDWLRLEGRRLRFAAEDAAREARALMTDDGLDADAVGAIAGVAVTSESLYLDEVPGQAAVALAAVAAGEVGTPWLQNGEWNVLAVNAKTVPSAEDPVLRERATEELLTEALRRQAAGRARVRGEF